MMSYFSVALGGAIGSVARYWLSGVVAARMGETFPAGTLVVNITGCFIAGLFMGLTGPDSRLLVPPTFRQFFLIGVCGGYTTFSSFSLQTLTLAQEGEWLSAGLNALASFTLCMLGVWLGYVAGMAVTQR